MRPLKWQIMSVYTNKLSRFFFGACPVAPGTRRRTYNRKNLEDVAVMALLAPW